jgi:hypothetical protein
MRVQETGSTARRLPREFVVACRDFARRDRQLRIRVRRDAVTMQFPPGESAAPLDVEYLQWVLLAAGAWAEQEAADE